MVMLEAHRNGPGPRSYETWIMQAQERIAYHYSRIDRLRMEPDSESVRLKLGYHFGQIGINRAQIAAWRHAGHAPLETGVIEPAQAEASPEGLPEAS